MSRRDSKVLMFSQSVVKNLEVLWREEPKGLDYSSYHVTVIKDKV